MDKTYDAACPHCGEVRTVKKTVFFLPARKGVKAVVCRRCDLPYVVSWKGDVAESRRSL